MERYFKRKSHMEEGSSSAQESCGDNPTQDSIKQSRLDLTNLPTDLWLQQKISSYHLNDQDEIRSAYVQKGPCQLVSNKFPQREIGGKLHRFNPAWFKKNGSQLEYSI